MSAHLKTANHRIPLFSILSIVHVFPISQPFVIRFYTQTGEGFALPSFVPLSHSAIIHRGYVPPNICVQFTSNWNHSKLSTQAHVTSKKLWILSLRSASASYRDNVFSSVSLVVLLPSHCTAHHCCLAGLTVNPRTGGSGLSLLPACKAETSSGKFSSVLILAYLFPSMYVFMKSWQNPSSLSLPFTSSLSLWALTSWDFISA